MASFKEKLALNLKNAQRILQLMRHTHRQRIQEEELEEEQERQVQGDHTFQSPHQTIIIDETKLRDEQSRPQAKVNGQPARWTAADRLELQFLKKAYRDYCSDMALIEQNEQNVLMAIDKIVQRLNGLKDSEEVIGRLRAKNQMLDEQLRQYQAENHELDEQLLKERYSEMRLVQQTQKNIRNLLKADQNDENEFYSGFARKWNSYLSELAQPPRMPENSSLDRQAIEQANRLIGTSLVNAEPQLPRPPPASMTKKKSEINSQLLGNLKEFSKNLKLPIDKKK